MQKIPDYVLESCIYESEYSVVYRGVREVDQQRVILKILNSSMAGMDTRALFQREFEIMCLFDSKGIIRGYDLIKAPNLLAIVMEDFGGQPLAQYRFDDSTKFTDFLKIAIQICVILDEIHRKNVIHKDINPNNLLWNAQHQQVKLIDFGISSQLSNEMPEICVPNLIEGTLRYISPEQTGRMNRSIDYRTDFYSLGITFYEMLAGRPPFASTDDLELIHSQLAKTSIPLHEVNPVIPAALSNIVAKLINKAPEDRYQSVFGLRHDLQTSLDLWQSRATIPVFQLAQKDTFSLLKIPEKLYGRDPEIKILLETFQRVADGSKEMLLVNGFSGIGKTALINEVQQPIVAQQGSFCAGKYVQLNRNIPYAALIEAFRNLIRQRLADDEATLQLLREELQQNLGGNNQVLIEVIPEMEILMGQQPELPTLPAKEVQNRFHFVFQTFIRILSSTHPLTVFLDDLQWADMASIRLIELLLCDPGIKKFLIIGAYRDNEVAAVHPLTMLVDRVQTLDIRVAEIKLQPMSLASISQLLHDTFHCHMPESDALAQLCLQKTVGNPFFLRQFIKHLYDGALIYYLFDQGKWSWNTEQINNQAITDNVVELMMNEIRLLPEKTQHLLAMASCIGRQFDLLTLAELAQYSPHAVAKLLWPALQENMIYPVNNNYRLLDLAMESESLNIDPALLPVYRFHHDRIQQAADSMLDKQQNINCHVRLGRILLGHLQQSRNNLEIFDVANHLNQGIDQLSAEQDKIQLADLNLQAGQKAKQAAAFMPAFEYFSNGIALIQALPWEQHRALISSLYEQGTEAALLTCNYAYMHKCNQAILQNANSTLAQVAAYETNIMACAAQTRMLDAIDSGMEILGKFGINLPINPGRHHVILALLQTKLLLFGKSVEAFADLPEMTDPAMKATMSIISKVAPAVYIAAPNLMPLWIIKLLTLSLRYGNAPESPFAYATYGLIQCGIFDNIKQGHTFGQLALKIMKNQNTRQVQCKTIYTVNAFITHWAKPYSETLQDFVDAYQIGLETGDLEYASYCSLSHNVHALCIGMNLQKLDRQITGYAEIFKKLSQEESVQLLYMIRQFVANLTATHGKNSQLNGKFFSETKSLPIYLQSNDKMMIFSVFYYKIQLAYLLAQYNLADEYVERICEHEEGAIALISTPVFYFYRALILLAVYPTSNAKKQRRIRYQVNKILRRVAKWASFVPDNHLHRYHIILAERAFIRGDLDEAKRQYQTGIQLAQRYGFIIEEAIGHERLGKTCFENGDLSMARVHLHQAYSCYETWGAYSKTNLLTETYPSIFADANAVFNEPQDRSDHTRTRRATTTTDRQLDLKTIIKASQTISQEIKLDRLLRALIKILIENAGAQKGYLFLCKGGQPSLEAQGIQGTQLEITIASTTIDTDQHALQFPISLIQYVSRTGENIVLSQADFDEKFQSDPYIKQERPKSVLCAPILFQGKLNGVIYLENNLLHGAFTDERLDVLQSLSAQLAISIHNAQLYQELVEAKERESIANKAKTAFLLNMNHELRTPLNHIMGFSEILIEDAIADGMTSYVADLQAIGKSGQQLLEIVDRILRISEFEAEDPIVGNATFFLIDMVSQLEKRIQEKAKYNQNHFSVVLGDSVNAQTEVQTDKLKLTHILNNLLDNACKFTKNGEISLHLSLTNNQIMQIIVKDTGIGISQEYFQTIFKPLVQLDESTTRQYGGIGLGLAIVDRYCNVLNASIQVESQVGDGTIFRLQIPTGGVSCLNVHS